MRVLTDPQGVTAAMALALGRNRSAGILEVAAVSGGLTKQEKTEGRSNLKDTLGWPRETRPGSKKPPRPEARESGSSESPPLPTTREEGYLQRDGPD